MRNAMRYIFILCLFLGFASCQEDVLQPSYKGKGRLVLKDVDISAEASAETVTRATSTFTAPTASELTIQNNRYADRRSGVQPNRRVHVFSIG